MGHAKNKSMPKEESLPPPEKPVVVKEMRYTRKQINDRETLALAIEELAQEVKTSLDEDAKQNGRYARRMRLENYIKTDSGKSSEQFPIVMPIQASCWNDVHLVEIELRIIKAVKERVTDLEHPWYRIRILFDDFIDALTKDLLDKMDRDESFMSGDIPLYKDPPADSSGSPKPSTSRQSTSTSSGRGMKSAAPKTVDVDDDDDVIFID